ncbi:hypothetical protein LTR37_001553 [Vermiconidia calcicola]|uniref:Uncharacterized protein n=1 Tax=Vermiconidia calcicola TaxID=1690605 RepID=A0ACC3NW25_9PEZI|nr:hypothetical protein LTR37_001553 [Vermiconidia calcicola]
MGGGSEIPQHDLTEARKFLSSGMVDNYFDHAPIRTSDEAMQAYYESHPFKGATNPYSHVRGLPRTSRDESPPPFIRLDGLVKVDLRSFNDLRTQDLLQRRHSTTHRACRRTNRTYHVHQPSASDPTAFAALLAAAQEHRHPFQHLSRATTAIALVLRAASAIAPAAETNHPSTGTTSLKDTAAPRTATAVEHRHHARTKSVSKSRKQWIVQQVNIKAFAYLAVQHAKVKAHAYLVVGKALGFDNPDDIMEAYNDGTLVRRGRMQNGDRHRRSQYNRGTTAQIQDEAVGVFCRSPTKPYAIIQYRISVRLPEHDVGNTLCGHREMRACVDLVVSIASLLMTSHTANAITASPITDLTTHGLNLSPPYWAVVVGTFRHQTGLWACRATARANPTWDDSIYDRGRASAPPPTPPYDKRPKPADRAATNSGRRNQRRQAEAEGFPWNRDIDFRVARANATREDGGEGYQGHSQSHITALSVVVM